MKIYEFKTTREAYSVKTEKMSVFIYYWLNEFSRPITERR